MVNLVYPKANEQFWQGGLNLLTADVRAVAVDTGVYGYLASHQFLSDIPVAAQIAASPSLATKTATNGTFDSADVVFAAFTGASIEAIVLYIHTGTASTSRLIAYIDTATGLPFQPNGSTLTVGTPNGWFTLGGTNAVLYARAGQQALQAGFNAATDNVKIVLINTSLYSFNQATHEFLQNIDVGARVATSGNLATKTFTDGTFDSADITISAVTGAQVGAWAAYVDTGNPATSRLLWYVSSNAGLPFTPNGGNLILATPTGWVTLTSTAS